MTNIQHPFLPGAVVFLRVGVNGAWVKDKVRKIFKNEIFSLESNHGVKYEAQQIWRLLDSPHWEGIPRPFTSYTSSVLLWSPEIEAEKRAESKP